MAKTHFQRKLEAKISERYDEVVLSLGAGGAPDFGGYQNEVGYLRGLRDVLTISENLASEEE